MRQQKKIQFNKIKVRPTLPGLYFFSVWLILLVASFSYNNSLGYLFTFALISVVFISVFHTYKNLLGLKLEVMRPEPAFVGQDLYLRIRVTTRAQHRDTIRLQWKQYHRVSFSVKKNTQKVVELPMPAIKRGLFYPKKIKVFTEYPFGLLRLSYKLKTHQACLIYPKPSERQISGLINTQHYSGKAFTAEGNEDFSGLRKYHPGDSLKHIAWKALARDDQVLVKQFMQPESDTVWADYNALSTDHEERLSILCRAILDEEHQRNAYGLKLPHLSLNPDNGEQHKRRCLKALALCEVVP